MASEISDTDIRELLGFADRLADAAAAVILPYFRAELEVVNKQGKGELYDPVTAADREAEAAMRALIQETYPSHGILGEEHGVIEGDGQVTWVLDPIDGTRSFVSGLTTWGVLIGINVAGQAVAGVMDQPHTGERFSGGPDGAFLNGNKLAVRDCRDLAEARLACTDAYMFKTEAQHEAFGNLRERCAFTRGGLDCYGYAMLAHGFMDLVVEGDLNPYDIQALIPIIEGAGGVVTTWDGGRAEDGGLVVAAGNTQLHKAAMEILATAL